MTKRFVLVAGNIGSGKTSLTERLGERLGWVTGFESVEDNPYLADLRAMLESPRVRKATGPLEVRDYVERVVLPQLTGLHDSLQIGTDDSFKRLRAASEQTERLIVRLQMLVDGSVDGLL